MSEFPLFDNPANDLLVIFQKVPESHYMFNQNRASLYFQASVSHTSKNMIYNCHIILSHVVTYFKR